MNADLTQTSLAHDFATESHNSEHGNSAYTMPVQNDSSESSALVASSETASSSIVLAETHHITTVIAGQTMTAVSGEILIDSTSLLPGGTALTISRTRVSLNSQGEVIVGTHIASASRIRAVITETAAPSTSGLLASQATESAAGELRIEIAGLVVVVIGVVALNDF